MFFRVLILLGLVLTVSLGGCATYSEAEFSHLRSAGLRPETLAKLERRKPLTPGDVLELRQRGVRDALVWRHLDKVGVNYLVVREDVIRLRRGGVRPAVIDALLRASDRFAFERAARKYDAIYGIHDPWISPFYGSFLFGIGASF